MKKFDIWTRLLIGLLLFHFISNLIWISINNAPFPWDQASHAELSLQAAEHIRSFQLISLFQISNYYPILLHTIAGFVLFLFGPHLKLTQILSTLIFTGTLAIIFLYFKELSKSSKLAFITACLFSFFPMVFHYSKWLMLDIPSVGSIFLTLFLWEKSQLLTDKKYTILTFFSLGILMMIKWTGVFFLTVPLAITLWHFFRQPHKMKQLTSVAYGIVIFLIIVLPWYATNLQQFIFLSKINLIGERGVDTGILTLQSFIRYIDEFINLQTTPYFTLVFIVCSAILLFKKWPRKYFIFSMILFAYLIFTFISNKDGRYTMPMLPFAAFVVAYGLERLRKVYKLAGNILTSAILLILFTYYLLLTIRPGAIEGAFYSFNIRIIRFDFVNMNDWLVKKYDPSSWEIPKILTDLKTISQDKSIHLLIGMENSHFNPATFRMYLNIEKYQNRLANINITTPDITYLITTYDSNSFPSFQAIETYLADSDYALVSPTNVGPTYIRNYDALSQIRDYIISNVDNASDLCRNYIEKIGPKDTICYVDASETLTTESDVLINSRQIQHGLKTISGSAQVHCPFGCSFRQVFRSQNGSQNITLVKSYTLPDATILNLYKLR